MNHYAYCLGDPVNRVDPSGLWSLSDTANVFNGISAVAGTVSAVAAVVAVGSSPTVVGGVSAGTVAVAAGVVATFATVASMGITEYQRCRGEVSGAEYATAQGLAAFSLVAGLSMNPMAATLPLVVIGRSAGVAGLALSWGSSYGR
jgi:hypothetical protein